MRFGTSSIPFIARSARWWLLGRQFCSRLAIAAIPVHPTAINQALGPATRSMAPTASLR